MSKQSTKRYMKLDSTTSQGLFMTYSRTDKNVYVVDKNGSKEPLTTNLTYNETNIASQTNIVLPPMTVAL